MNSLFFQKSSNCEMVAKPNLRARHGTNRSTNPSNQAAKIEEKSRQIFIK